MTKREVVNYAVDSLCFVAVVAVLLVCMLAMWGVIIGVAIISEQWGAL